MEQILSPHKTLTLENNVVENNESNLDEDIDNFFDLNPRYCQFLQKNAINLQGYQRLLKDYAKSGLRCVRIRNKPTSTPKTVQDIRSEILKYPNAIQHPLFKDLVLLPRSFRIANLTPFKQG